MRILILYPHLGPGVANFLIDFARCLKERGFEPILATRGGAGLGRVEEYGIEHKKIELKFPYFLRHLREFCSFIRETQVDLIDCRDHKAGSVGYILSRITKTPYLLGIHAPKKWYNRFLAYYWSNPVMAVNRADKQNLREVFKIPEEKVIITSVGIDTARHAPAPPNREILDELGISSNTPVIMMVGRYERRKTIPARVLIESMPRISEKFPDAVAVLVGSGRDVQDVRDLARATNEQLGREAVRMLGYRRDVQDLYRVARVVVGAGKVGLEAMASGKPLIGAGRFGTTGITTPDNASMAEDTLFGDHGPAEPLDARRLSSDLLRILCDPRLEDELRKFGPTFARKFDIDTVADGIIKIYEAKLNGRYD